MTTPKSKFRDLTVANSASTPDVNDKLGLISRILQWLDDNGRLAVSAINGVLSIGQGGTGQFTYDNGQLLIGNGTTKGLDKATLTAGTNVTVTNGAGTITIAAAGPGTSGVSGPSSATNADIAVFDGTTGKIIKDSGKVVPAGAVVGTTDAQTLAVKTLLLPTIADFSNATHGHQNAAGGGTLDAAAIATGQLALARGGTGSDLSATGGTHQVLRQSTLGGAVTISQLAAGDVSGLAASATTDTTNASNISTGTLPAGRLPNPSATALGGVESAAAVSHQWIDSISTSGVPHLSQPAFTDISGAVAAAQLPNPSATTLGGIESIAATSHQWIDSISTSGVPHQSQPVFSDVLGSVAAAQMPALTGDITTTAGTVATTLASVNVGSGTTGDASHVAQVTTNAKGLVTSQSSISISITPTAAGLSNVTNDAQTKAAVVPNTAPSAGQVLVGNAGGTAYAPQTMGTDATLSSAGALTIANSAVTLAKMANMATSSLIYRKTAGSGAPEVNTLAMLKTDLGLTGTNSGDQTISLTGDVTGSGTGSFAATIAANAVTDAKFRQGTALTVVGRSANSTGNTADIQATAASGAVLRESGSTLGFGTIATAGIAANAVTLAKMDASNATANKVLMSGASASPTWSTPTFPNASATAGKFIRSDGTNWLASTATHPDTFARGDVLVATSTNVLAALAVGGSGSLMYASGGTDPAWTTNTHISVDNANSRIGIGTSGPAETVDIAAQNAVVRFNDSTDIKIGYIGVTGANYILTGMAAGDMGIRSPGAMLLGTNGNNVRATIASTGELGIGAAPSGAGLLHILCGGSTTLSKAGGTIAFSSTTTGNTAATETDIRTVTLAASILNTNGDGVGFHASGSFAATAAVNKRIIVYFGGTAIFDSGSLAITSASTWRLVTNVDRTSSTAVTCSTTLSSSATGALTAVSQETSVTGLTLSNTQILKVTGNGTNANDVVAHLWKVSWSSAP